MLEARIEPPDKLDLVSSTLRRLGDKQLARELSRALNRATEGLREDARESAAETLPRRGGLAERVVGAKLSTRRRSGRNPGITISAAGMDQLGLMDEGIVRHRVFGQPDVWVAQKITGGWFTKPMEAGADDVARELEKALDETAEELARKLDSP